MRIVRSLNQMQKQALAWRRSNQKVGLVPTMGFLHEGHLSLVRIARKAVGSKGIVTLSIYVNPIQFGPSEDFHNYPRDIQRDLALCRNAGVDLVFLPSDSAMYPNDGKGGSSTFVVEETLSRGMEGASRPGHFRGVATVVTKLFNLVQPTVAVFGAKDYQQAAVIRRMAADLNQPVKILVGPTLREKDGLAMSSRNRYLNPEQRRQAGVLFRALQRCRKKVRAGTTSPVQLKKELSKLMKQHPLVKLDYVAFFHPDTLEPQRKILPGCHMALAVRFGKTRLIDNARL